MSFTRSRLLPSLGVGAVLASLLAAAACGSSSSSAAPGASSGSVSAAAGQSVVTAASESTDVAIAQHTNGAGTATTITVPTVASIRAELPASIRESGKLVIGQGALPAGFPPLSFIGDDQKTLTGSEPDLGRLIAAVYGLQPEIVNATWDNLFVGIDSGKTDVGISNITDTETRKQKYDFASYRQDNLGFEVNKSSTWNFNGNYQNLAGKTVAVASGTNQEKILLEWQAELKAEGKSLDVKYYPTQAAVNLALSSGKIDIYFGPNPGIAYHVKGDASGPNPTRNAGTHSGAGATLQGLIAATTKKGNGLARPLADAINYLIKNGQYAKWLAAYNLSNEAVPTSLVNPPGLPKTNS
ncbi:polar amino acid transport system substrate-binding protein [Nakamurella panacisegetis]|uniref:Polar amino acid transport system substrate-binding protein n=1 Tax=Nakamurella panacisegetis TaxID=1090615 RepID=A0A1H0NKA8_9ACTN|nr:ABC transporter substrate-binding protein [Nakamurella panacisegetis]SDO92770.1 polar amino acid transport system substrate-binding protein [Nakamurella panacisegetis]